MSEFNPESITKLKAVRNTVLIYVPKIKEKTINGIIMPEQHVDRRRSGSQNGQVIHIGRGVQEDAEYDGWGVGTHVLFAQYAGVKQMDGDKEFRVIYYDDIMGIDDQEACKLEYEDITQCQKN